MRFSSIIGILAALMTSSACFNHRGAGKAVTSSQSHLTQYSQTDDSNALYLCPTAPNIIPSYDRRLDGSGYFRACRHRTSNADVKLHGQAYSNSGVCIFPIQYVDSRNIYAKPDLQTGLPWSQCYPLPTSEGGTVVDSGIYANFPGISWNAVVVVDPYDNLAMRACLSSGQLSQCPDYSLGKFR